jgi:hypothetical protein
VLPLLLMQLVTVMPLLTPLILLRSVGLLLRRSCKSPPLVVCTAAAVSRAAPAAAINTAGTDPSKRTATAAET